MTDKHIEKLDDSVDKLRERIASLEGKVDSLESISSENRRALYGSNGTGGIVSRLESLEKFTNDLRRFFWAIIGVLVVLIVTQLYNIYIIQAQVSIP